MIERKTKTTARKKHAKKTSISKKKASVSKKKAYSAAKTAKRAYAKKAAKRPASWEKGGKEWSRVLGHFGITVPSSHKS
jgi:hypothetical protein